MTKPSPEIIAWMDTVPALKSSQIQTAHESAQQRVRQDLGTKPPDLSEYLEQLGQPPQEPVTYGWRGTFREIRNLADPLDILIPPLVGALLSISLAHMFHFAGGVAATSYATESSVSPAGITISSEVWALIHQFGFSGVSEIPILYFFTRFNLERKKEKTARSFFSLAGNLLAALVSVFITLVANVSSLLHTSENTEIDNGYKLFLIFVGIALPLLTMFLGHRLSEILEKYLEKKAEEKKNYEEKLLDYNNAIANKRVEWEVEAHEYHQVWKKPELHPHFGQFFHQAIVDYYKQRLPKATGLSPEDWSLEHELWLGRRERYRQKEMEKYDEGMDYFHEATDNRGVTSREMLHSLTPETKEFVGEIMEKLTEKKEIPPHFSFSRVEKKQKGPNKLDLVIAWMQSHPEQLQEKNQVTLEAYEADTGQKTNLPYIREAKKKVSGNDTEASQ